MPDGPDANAAAAVQELMGGKFGEMSTLINYTFQSFNFRGRSKFRPYFDLISNIAAEEYSHIELVAATINRRLKRRASIASCIVGARTTLRNKIRSGAASTPKMTATSS